MSDRRNFFKKSGLLGLGVLASKFVSAEKIEALEKLGGGDFIPFTLHQLPYAYDALEPYIDKQTMEIHHGKHHAAYVNKLNELKSTQINYQISDAAKCVQIDGTFPTAIRNNLGGHYNHSLFWTLMKANPKGETNSPTGKLLEAINKDFVSMEEFKKEFSEKSLKIFGSGWCWLILQGDKLKIRTTANQDNPLMNVDTDQGKIILCLDVWEHAYYLKYQNVRVDYIKNWWNLVNWNKAQELFEKK